MVCAPVRSIIPSLKLGDYLSVQAHNPCSISHLDLFILIIWKSPFVVVEFSDECFHFYCNFGIEIPASKKCGICSEAAFRGI